MQNVSPGVIDVLIGQVIAGDYEILTRGHLLYLRTIEHKLVTNETN